MQQPAHQSFRYNAASPQISRQQTSLFTRLIIIIPPRHVSRPRLNPTCSTEISFPAHHHHHSSPVINGRQGWAVRVPAPELSISSSTPMQVGPISSRAPDARHAILTYASCCAATRHLRHATPSFPPTNPTGHLQQRRHPPSRTSCWGTAQPEKQFSCIRPLCRGIVNHKHDGGSPPSILDSRGGSQPQKREISLATQPSR